MDENFSSIQQNPFADPIVYNDIPRKLFPRFPYGLFYVIQDDIVFVLACFHVKREPKQWQRR